MIFSDPKDYYAVIPYQDINKLFDLLNKHVNEPIKHDMPKMTYKKEEKKKKKRKDKPKTTVTHYNIPHVRFFFFAHSRR